VSSPAADNTRAEAPGRRTGFARNGFVVLAGFFLLIAAGLQFGLRPTITRQVAAYRAAPVLSVKEARAREDGAALHLDAAVTEANAPLLDDLVAYEIEEYQSGTTSQSGWWVSGADTPPLALRDPAGDTITVRGDYALHGDLLVIPDGDTRRYRGVRAGDSVSVFGRLDRAEGAVSVVAEVVSIGDAAGFVEGQVEGLDILGWVVAASAALGLLFAAAHLWSRRRRSA
jgi:hypothetical protein